MQKSRGDGLLPGHPEETKFQHLPCIILKFRKGQTIQNLIVHAIPYFRITVMRALIRVIPATGH